MTVAGMDLNLLIALRAMLEEANVTRAGERIGMAQPAMSTALGPAGNDPRRARAPPALPG
jgi:hypothetical protein